MLASFAMMAFSGVFAQVAHAYGQDKVVFQSNRDGDNEIIIMNLDGTGVTQLTNNTGADLAPVFSKGGERVAFGSNRDGDHEIYTMKNDGTDVRQVTDNAAKDQQPAYSPHSNLIAFVREDATGAQDILGLDTSVIEGATDPVTNEPNTALPLAASSTYNELRPSFADDGRMLYDRNGATNREIAVMDQNFETSTVIPPESSTTSEWAAQFSRDGTKIIYTRGTGNAANIYSMNPDGTGRTGLVTYSNSNDHDPSFYPDASKVVYSSPNSGNNEIYKANTDGTGKTSITNNAASDEHPDVRTVTGDTSFIKEIVTEPEETLTTASVSAGANDAEVNGASFSNNGTDITVRNNGTTGRMNGLISLDTSAVPDANTIQEAELVLKVDSATISDNFGLVVDYYNWVGNASDFSSAQSEGSATGSTGAVAIKDPAYVAGDEVRISLDPSSINKTGTTKFRLRLIDLGQTATGTNAVNFASYENITYAEPKIEILSDNASLPDTQQLTVEFGNEPANSEAAASFECKLDTGSWSACTSPKVYTGVSTGVEHQVSVRSIDGSSQPEPNPVENTVYTDMTDTTIPLAYTPVTHLLEPVFNLLARMGGPLYAVLPADHEHHADSVHGAKDFGVGTPETEALLARAITESFRPPYTAVPGWAHWRSELYVSRYGTTDGAIRANKGRAPNTGLHQACAIAYAQDYTGRNETHKAIDCSFSWNQGEIRGEATHTHTNHERHTLNVTNEVSRH